MHDSNQNRTTLPYSAYWDPATLVREQTGIFSRRWQYVGHAGQIAEPGTIATARTGNAPVLLVRDHEGEARAFLNVCRHRGSQLVTEDCKRATIQCPYHAWTYDLDGRLRSAPRLATESDLEMADLALVPLALGQWGPFLFANADLEADPLAETLGDLPDLVASAGVDVDALVFRKRAHSEYDANWKICSENFLECYHCQIAHPGLAEVIDISIDSYRLEEDRWFSSQYGPVKDGWTGDFDPTGSVGHGQFHFLYPNVTINIAPGSPNISIGPILPDGPERTTRFLDYFFAPDADPSWIETMLEWDDQVGEEDTVLVERVQRGVRSGAIERGVLLESERLIAHFDRLVLADLD